MPHSDLDKLDAFIRSIEIRGRPPKPQSDIDKLRWVLRVAPHLLAVAQTIQPFRDLIVEWSYDHDSTGGVVPGDPNAQRLDVALDALDAALVELSYVIEDSQ